MKLLSLEANKIILNSKQPRKEFDNEKLEVLDFNFQFIYILNSTLLFT